MRSIWCNYLLQAKRTSLSVSTAVLTLSLHDQCRAEHSFISKDVCRAGNLPPAGNPYDKTGGRNPPRRRRCARTGETTGCPVPSPCPSRPARHIPCRSVLSVRPDFAEGIRGLSAEQLPFARLSRLLLFFFCKMNVFDWHFLILSDIIVSGSYSEYWREILHILLMNIFRGKRA